MNKTQTLEALFHGKGWEGTVTWSLRDGWMIEVAKGLYIEFLTTTGFHSPEHMGWTFETAVERINKIKPRGISSTDRT